MSDGATKLLCNVTFLEPRQAPAFAATGCSSGYEALTYESTSYVYYWKDLKDIGPPWLCLSCTQNSQQLLYADRNCVCKVWLMLYKKARLIAQVDVTGEI
jgi:hypothetical protein